MSSPTIAQLYQRIQILFVAMLTSQLLFGIVVFVLIYTGQLGEPDYSIALLFQQIAMFLVPASMAAGYFVFKSIVSKIDRRLPVTDRLVKYQSAFLVRAALFEVPFLFLGVAAFVTREKLFLYVAPVILLSFVLLRPSADAITSDLELNQSDREKFKAK